MSRLHTVINTIATPRQVIGVGRYVRCLVAALPDAGPDHRFTLLVARGLREWLPADGGPIDLRVLPVPARPSYLAPLWHPLVARMLRETAADVYHLPNTMPVLRATCPVVVSLHDVQEFRIRRYGIARSLYRRTVGRLAARRAARIITMSACSKRDIVRFLGVSADKVTVIPEGVEDHFFAPGDTARDAATVAHLGIQGPYLLAVGEIQPGKNLATLARAFARVARDLPHTLVLAGKRGWQARRILEEIAATPAGGRVNVLGYVDEPTLLALYRRADAFVFPSLYEGFGLPLLEAMAAGAPVISSDASSLPEVAGDAAVLVPPTEDALADAILRLARDPSLREELAARGARRARRFSWRETARSTVAVYEEVAGCRAS